jgi:hypothetical protein
MDDSPAPSPATRPTVLEEGRQASDPVPLDVDSNAPNPRGRNEARVHLEEPQRPQLYKRNTMVGQSAKSLSEALRLARSREEQETLLGEGEEADDDGCYPPRKSDEPRAPNPHRGLPIYTTIHKIRRLILASIGRAKMADVTVYRAGSLIRCT